MLNRLKNMAARVRSAFKPAETRTTYIAGSGYTPYRVGSYGSGDKFPGGMSRGASIVYHDHFTLRQQVREALYDSVEARALVESITETVVDTGLKLKPTPKADILKIDPEAAEQWAENVADAFHLWAKSKNSCRSRINTFYQNQRLYGYFQQRDNDIFVRFYYSKEPGITNPLQIDFVDPNQIRGHAFTSSYFQGPHNDGIIRDNAGREIGYKIWSYDNNGGFREQVIPARGEKSGRVFMLHGYNPEYAGQGRGFPRLTHALQNFENLTDFNLSTIQKAINQASFVMAIENDQTDASNPLEGRVAGPVAQYGSFPQPAADALNVPDTIEPVINWQLQPEATIHSPGSTVLANLKKGDKIKFLQDTSPSASYDAFVKAFFSSICASTSWSIEVVLKQFNQNYSASRATLILCWREAVRWRMEMAADFLDAVYEAWLSEEIAAGRISAPGWSDPYMRAAWLCCEWAGSPMPNIDPLKTAKADREYVELGAQTLDDVAMNYNGSSGKANRIKNKRQFSELPEAPWNEKPEPAPVQPEPEKDNDDEAEKTEARITDKTRKIVSENLEQLMFRFAEIEKEIIRASSKPAPAPAQPDITIPVDIKIHVERDAEKAALKKTVSLKHDEKGRLIGASVDEVKDAD